MPSTYLLCFPFYHKAPLHAPEYTVTHMTHCYFRHVPSVLFINRSLHRRMPGRLHLGTLCSLTIKSRTLSLHSLIYPTPPFTRSIVWWYRGHTRPGVTCLFLFYTTHTSVIYLSHVCIVYYLHTAISTPFNLALLYMTMTYHNCRANCMVVPVATSYLSLCMLSPRQCIYLLPPLIIARAHTSPCNLSFFSTVMITPWSIMHADQSVSDAFHVMRWLWARCTWQLAFSYTLKFPPTPMAGVFISSSLIVLLRGLG